LISIHEGELNTLLLYELIRINEIPVPLLSLLSEAYVHHINELSINE